MNELTERQRTVYEYIRACIETGMPPTRADISKHFGWRSANAAEEHVQALVRKGYIEHAPGLSRGLRLP